MTNKTAWAHLPNAKHIDWVLADVKPRSQVWGAAWDARLANRDGAFDASDWEVARGAAREVAWYAARGAARDAAREVAWYAAQDAVAALVAWDHAGDLLAMTEQQLREIIDRSKDPAAILLLPAVIARESADKSGGSVPERHAQEMAAYELTVSNLRERMAQRGDPVAWVWRFSDGELNETPFQRQSECERDAVGYDGKAIPLYAAPQPAEPGAHAQFWDLRSKILALPRYSFLLNKNGGVAKVADSCGNWIEVYAAAGLCEAVRVDAMIAAAPHQVAHPRKTDWARGFEAGVASNIDIAKEATGALQKERAEHAEMSRMMTEALLQAEGLAATPQPAQPELTDAEIRPLIPKDMDWKYVITEAGAAEFASAIIATHEAKRGAA